MEPWLLVLLIVGIDRYFLWCQLRCIQGLFGETQEAFKKFEKLLEKKQREIDALKAGT